MQEIWPGAKLNDADTRLLRKAMAPDLSEQSDESQPNNKYTFDKVDSAVIDLGTVGKGVIVLMSGSTMCGTGGCPICIYVREKVGYRKVLSSFGWAFAVLSSHATVPDLVIASNLSGGIIVLTLYRYFGKIFTSKGCETLTAKEGAPSGRSRFDPAAVVVSPCGTQAP
jgi:hypothetical protein